MSRNLALQSHESVDQKLHRIRHECQNVVDICQIFGVTDAMLYVNGSPCPHLTLVRCETCPKHLYDYAVLRVQMTWNKHPKVCETCQPIEPSWTACPTKFSGLVFYTTDVHFLISAWYMDRRKIEHYIQTRGFEEIIERMAAAYVVDNFNCLHRTLKQKASGLYSADAVTIRTFSGIVLRNIRAIYTNIHRNCAACTVRMCDFYE